MRRVVIIGVVVGALATACGGSSAGRFRYYDPWRNFTVDIPAQLPFYGPGGPRQIAGLGTLLSGVIASEPTTQSTQLSFGAAQQQQQAVPQEIQLVVLGDTGFTSAEDMVTLQTADETADLRFREPLHLAGVEALLVVTDHADPAGNPLQSVASVFAISDGKAYWIRHVFPHGTWEEHKATLYAFVNSFRFGVPASVHLEPTPA